MANCSPYRSPAAHHQLHASWGRPVACRHATSICAQGSLSMARGTVQHRLGKPPRFQLLGLRPCKQLCRRQHFAGHEYHLALQVAWRGSFGCRHLSAGRNFEGLLTCRYGNYMTDVPHTADPIGSLQKDVQQHAQWASLFAPVGAWLMDLEQEPREHIVLPTSAETLKYVALFRSPRHAAKGKRCQPTLSNDTQTCLRSFFPNTGSGVSNTQPPREARSASSTAFVMPMCWVRPRRMIVSTTLWHQGQALPT